MPANNKHDAEFGQQHLGVWDPTGGEIRNGSGLPVEEGIEEIRVLGCGAQGGRVREVLKEELGSLLGEPGCTFWVDILRPRAEAKALLQETLKLGPLTVEDCIAPLRMPKIDILRENEKAPNCFMAAFALQLQKGNNEVRLRAVEVDLVIGPNYLVTVRDGHVPEVTQRLERRLHKHDLLEGSGQILAYEVLDTLIDGHLPVLASTATAAEELEESLDPRNERVSLMALENLIALKRDLSAFRRLAVAQQDALRRLGREYIEMRPYLSDVADNQRETVDMADATRDYVDGAVEAYQMRRDEWAGIGIRRLTVLAGVLGPLSVLAAWYGTNFSYIPGADSPYAFYIFVGIQVLFVILTLLYLRRRNWI
ncbi:MAG: magnesium transporter CorA family protein [Rubrobacter sp.]|nr:magnesium transporter CorA family protein [Rubrobacter sp.]